MDSQGKSISKMKKDANGDYVCPELAFPQKHASEIKKVIAFILESDLKEGVESNLTNSRMRFGDVYHCKVLEHTPFKIIVGIYKK
jgi:hypothetical protein